MENNNNTFATLQTKREGEINKVEKESDKKKLNSTHIDVKTTDFNANPDISSDFNKSIFAPSPQISENSQPPK